MDFNDCYLPVMVAAASCMLVTGFILAIVKAPSDERGVKYRMAKNTLTGAVLILGVLNLVQVAFDSGGTVSYLGSCFALAISYLQAMLFTMTVLVLIRPDVVTWRTIFIQLGIILVVDAMLVGAFFLMPRQTFLYVYDFCIVLYLAQLAYYVWWFRRCRSAFINQIDSYYEEEEIERGVRWIRFIFWAALAVGLLSLLMLLNNSVVDLCLTIALALFYALFAACFINYGYSATVVFPAIYQQENLKEKEPEPGGMSKLELWIKNKGYLDNDMAVSEIAALTDMSVDQLHRYFRDVMGEEFRTWRVHRRIEEAKQLMVAHPEYSTTRIGKLSGFNDRSFFYQQFLRFTGVTVAAFRGKLQQK